MKVRNRVRISDGRGVQALEVPAGPPRLILLRHHVQA